MIYIEDVSYCLWTDSELAFDRFFDNIINTRLMQPYDGLIYLFGFYYCIG